MKILVSGSIAYDVLLGHDGSFTDALDPKKLAELSVAYLAPHYAKHHGGTGANISWNVRLLGGDPLLVGSVGSDGGSYAALLSERGINVQYIDTIDDAVTATAIIATDTGERQITFFHPGADAKGAWPDLNDERDDLVYAIVSPRDSGLMQSAASWCEKFKVPFLFDPGQQIPAFSKAELERLTRASSGVVVNEYEWELLSKILGVTEKKFLALCPLLLVTRGEKGVRTITAEGSEDIDACKADHVMNPTGAGDAFRAGLLFGFSQNWSLRDSCRLGCGMGSFVVEIEGTLLDTLDVGLLHERIRKTYRENLPQF
jgi:adenosine kinase